MRGTGRDGQGRVGRRTLGGTRAGQEVFQGFRRQARVGGRGPAHGVVGVPHRRHGQSGIGRGQGPYLGIRVVDEVGPAGAGERGQVHQVRRRA